MRRSSCGVWRARRRPRGAARAGSGGAHALSPALLVLHESRIRLGRGHVEDADSCACPAPICGRSSPPNVAATGAPTVAEDDESVTARWTVDCGAARPGRRADRRRRPRRREDRRARCDLELADGRAIDTVLRAREPSFVVPDREHRVALASRYVDARYRAHPDRLRSSALRLRSVAARRRHWRRCVATITAFTLGHSVTLTLAVLDVARVPSAPVEVLIAFSIFVLAVELARRRRTATRRSCAAGRG